MDRKIIKFATAAIIYAGFAFYLYSPHLHNRSLAYYLIPANLFFGSFGCFIVSKRWIGNFFGEFFAGLLYGFGPFFIGLSPHHPLSGTMAAAIPWLFAPAAFLTKDKWVFLKVLFYILPFGAIIFFFQLTSQLGFFPINLQTRLRPADLTGLISGLAAAKQNLTLIGFYHVPLAALMMGGFMMVAAKRYLVLMVLAAGVAGGFCIPFLDVSPVMWISVSAFCFSILIGIGLQGLSISGSADGKLLLAIISFMLILAVACAMISLYCDSYFAGIGAGYANLFAVSSKMYLVAAVSVGIIYVLTKIKLPTRSLRWAVLISAMASDVFFSARFIVDSMF